MMDQLWKITAICLVGSILAVLVKKTSPDVGIAVSLAVVGTAGMLLLRLGGEALSAIRQMLEVSGLLPDLFRPLVKITGIALLSRLGSDLCRDAGESAIASLVETFGAFGAVAVSLPLFASVWDMLHSML